MSFAGGYIPRPLNKAVTTSAWTAIKASGSTVEFQVKTRTGTPFKISDSATGATYYTVATDTVIQFDCPTPKNTIIFYIQTVSSDDTLEVFLLNK